MYPDDSARYCQKCSVLHMENCKLCWGFGLKFLDYFGHGPLPVTAREASQPEMLKGIYWYQCPMCEGTPYGPAGTLLRIAS